MNLTPMSYSSKDKDELVPSEAGAIGSPEVKKPGLIIITLFSIFKAGVSIFLGISTTTALMSKTSASGYPVWIFVYAFYLMAIGVAYLCALLLVLRYKRLGLILMIVFVLSDILYSILLVIGGIGTLSLIGLSFNVLLLSMVYRNLRSEPQASFFT